MVSTLLWDVDGTLLNFEKSEDYSLRKCLADIGVTADSAMVARYSEINTRYWKALERGEISRERVREGRFEEFFAREGIDCRDIPAFNIAYQTRLGEVYFPNDGALELVAKLRSRLRQYAVTNGSALAQHGKLRLSGLAQLLDGVFISEELGVEKPDPEFFRKVFAALPEAVPEHTVIVGDSLTSDMLGGMRAGIRCWWYNPEGKACPPEITVQHQLRDLNEIPALLEQE